jgi:glutathione peroxidase-family protein
MFNLFLDNCNSVKQFRRAGARCKPIIRILITTTKINKKRNFKCFLVNLRNSSKNDWKIRAQLSAFRQARWAGQSWFCIIVLDTEKDEFWKQLETYSGFAPRWNFWKYLIDEEGFVRRVYAHWEEVKLLVNPKMINFLKLEFLNSNKKLWIYYFFSRILSLQISEKSATEERSTKNYKRSINSQKSFLIFLKK